MTSIIEKISSLFHKKNYSEKKFGRAEVKKMALAQLGSLQSSNSSSEEIFTKFFSITHDFLLQALHLKPGFTSDELEKELPKRRIPATLKKRLLVFLERASMYQYSGKEKTTQELNQLINEFRAIIQDFPEPTQPQR